MAFAGISAKSSPTSTHVHFYVSRTKGKARSKSRSEVRVKFADVCLSLLLKIIPLVPFILHRLVRKIILQKCRFSIGMIKTVARADFRPTCSLRLATLPS